MFVESLSAARRFFCHSSSVLYLLLTAHRIQQPISKLQVRDFTNFLTNYNKFYKSLFGNGFFVRNNLTGVNNSWKFRISSHTSSQLICTQTKIWILFVESLSVARFFLPTHPTYCIYCESSLTMLKVAKDQSLNSFWSNSHFQKSLPTVH